MRGVTGISNQAGGAAAERAYFKNGRWREEEIKTFTKGTMSARMETFITSVIRNMALFATGVFLLTVVCNATATKTESEHASRGAVQIAAKQKHWLE